MSDFLYFNGTKIKIYNYDSKWNLYGYLEIFINDLDNLNIGIIELYRLLENWILVRSRRNYYDNIVRVEQHLKHPEYYRFYFCLSISKYFKKYYICG